MNDSNSNTTMRNAVVDEIKKSPISTSSAIIAIVTAIVGLFFWAFATHYDLGNALIWIVVSLGFIPVSIYFWSPTRTTKFDSVYARTAAAVLALIGSSVYQSMVNTNREFRRISEHLKENSIDMTQYLETMPPMWILKLTLYVSMISMTIHALLLVSAIIHPMTFKDFEKPTQSVPEPAE